MKKLILLFVIALISIYCLACGKVHETKSQLKIINAVVTDNGSSKDANSFESGIDLYQGKCCDNSGKRIDEPFYDAIVSFNVQNHLKQNIYPSHFYYIIKNYDEYGNDYISPNMALQGQLFIPAASDSGSVTPTVVPTNSSGNTTNNSNSSSSSSSSVKLYGLFLNARGGIKVFPGSNELVKDVGFRNVIFYLYATAENGDEIVTRATSYTTFSYYNNCPSSHNADCGNITYATVDDPNIDDPNTNLDDDEINDL